jgi:hypothetical protein
VPGNYFEPSIHEWEELIINLRRMVEHTTKTPAPIKIPEREYFTTQEASIISWLKNKRFSKWVTPQQQGRLVEFYDKLFKFYDAQHQGWKRGVFHMDIHPHNMIFKNKKLAAFTDFESFQKSILEVSVGFSIYKCLREMIAAEGWQGRKMRMLDDYESVFSRYFQSDSFAFYIQLGQIDVLKRALFILGELAEKGDSSWLFMFETQFVCLEEAEALIRCYE